MHLEHKKRSRISVTMEKKINRPMLENEKQFTPMKGEVTLENARLKAHVFAKEIKSRLIDKGVKFK